MDIINSDSDLLSLRRRVDVQRKTLELAKKFGLLLYKPHAKQQMFHAAAHFKFRLARCGNRFGKSDMGVSEDLAFALGERPWLSKDDPMRYHGIPKHPTKGLVIVANDDKIDEIFTGTGSKGHVGKIWKKIPKELVVGTKRSSSGTIVNLRIKGLYGESVIDFDTRSAFKTNPIGAESGDYDWVHIDEPIEEAHFKAISRGLMDRGGKAWFTCTLLEQPWINDFFFSNAENSKKDLFAEQTEDGRYLKWAITGTTHDNPYLSKEDIEDFLNTLSEDERQCRINGIPLHLSGLVYKQFDSARHVFYDKPNGWASLKDPPLDYTLHYAIDPHPRTPTAILFVAVSPTGRAYIYDEIFLAATTKKLSKLILEKTEGRFVFTRIADPLAFIEDERNLSCMATDFIQNGVLGLVRAPKDLTRGISAVQEALAEPDFIYVSCLCKRFIWEINRYGWKDQHGVPTNKPVDKDDHMMENFYRLVLRGLNYYDRQDIAGEPVDDIVITSDMDLGSLSLDI